MVCVEQSWFTLSLPAFSGMEDPAQHFKLQSHVGPKTSITASVTVLTTSRPSPTAKYFETPELPADREQFALLTCLGAFVPAIIGKRVCSLADI